MLISLPIEAQNWQNICSPGLTLFGDSIHNISSFRLDSVQAGPLNPLDSFYWSYPTIRKILNNQSCYDTVFGSVLGKKVYRRANGTFVFFNLSGDSIFFKTDATLSQSWKLFSLPNLAYILATVSEHKVDFVCGMPDEIKVITLQAKDATNQNIDNVFNNKQIVLSKNYGLIHIYDMVKFPSDTVPYTLEGKSSPPIGLQDFTIQEAYNYNIGDEFHYDNFAGCSLGFRDEKIIKVILTKEVSITGDTIVYSSDRCIHRVEGPPFYINFHDTITDTIILHKHPFYLIFNNQPHEFSPKQYYKSDEFYKNGTSFNSRSKKRFYEDYYKYSPSLNCWVANFIYHPPCTIYFPYYDFSKGLGQTYYFYQYFYFTEFDLYVVTNKTQLVYYRKGNETWGTPWAPDCATLVGTKESTTLTVIPGITISPNPVHNFAEIKITGLKPGEKAVIILYDYLGQEVFQDHLELNPYILTRDGIPNGIYIVKIVGKSGVLNITSKVLFN